MSNARKIVNTAYAVYEMSKVLCKVEDTVGEPLIRDHIKTLVDELGASVNDVDGGNDGYSLPPRIRFVYKDTEDEEEQPRSRKKRKLSLPEEEEEEEEEGKDEDGLAQNSIPPAHHPQVEALLRRAKLDASSDNHIDLLKAFKTLYDGTKQSVTDLMGTSRVNLYHWRHGNRLGAETKKDVDKAVARRLIQQFGTAESVRDALAGF